MVNLIAGKLVVPELIQSHFTAANIVRQIEPLLPDGALRESMMKELARIRGLLNPRQGLPGTNSTPPSVAWQRVTIELLSARSTATLNANAGKVSSVSESVQS